MLKTTQQGREYLIRRGLQTLVAMLVSSLPVYVLIKTVDLSPTKSHFILTVLTSFFLYFLINFLFMFMEMHAVSAKIFLRTNLLVTAIGLVFSLLGIWFLPSEYITAFFGFARLLRISKWFPMFEFSLFSSVIATYLLQVVMILILHKLHKRARKLADERPMPKRKKKRLKHLWHRILYRIYRRRR